MTIDIEPTNLPVITRGHVSDEHRDYAADKISQLLSDLDEPVLFAEVKLTQQPDPARPRPAEAEAVIDLNGAPVRAHVAAEVMNAAIDLLEDRLRRRINQRAEVRDDLHRHRTGAGATDGGRSSWRHGEVPAERPEHFQRPVEERELIRRKTFAVGEMTPDEAVDLLDLLGHDFLLFANLHTGADAVVAYAPSGDYELTDTSGHDDVLGDDTVAPIRRSHRGVPRMTIPEAEEELDLDLEPFVFFVDPDTSRGNVAYRRYDGHYGLISPA